MIQIYYMNLDSSFQRKTFCVRICFRKNAKKAARTICFVLWLHMYFLHIRPQKMQWFDFACYDVNKTGSCVSPNEKSNTCYHIWSENKNTHFSINVQYIDKLYFWGFVIYTKCGMICNHNIKEWYTVSLKKVYASLNTDNYFFLVQMISKLILVQRKPGE